MYLYLFSFFPHVNTDTELSVKSEQRPLAVGYKYCARGADVSGDNGGPVVVSGKPKQDVTKYFVTS